MCKCKRKACQQEIDIKYCRSYYKIWNNINVTESSIYCLPCGKKIVEYNPSIKFEIGGPKCDNCEELADQYTMGMPCCNKHLKELAEIHSYYAFQEDDKITMG